MHSVPLETESPRLGGHLHSITQSGHDILVILQTIFVLLNGILLLKGSTLLQRSF